MGNEVSAVGGAVCTTAAATASVLTLGQVEAINSATAECARFTADKASRTTVRHLAEATGTAAAAAGATLAVGVTLGQVLIA